MMYEGIRGKRGEWVGEDEACEYAMKECGIGIVDFDAPERAAFEKALVEWYFSGGDWTGV